MSPRFATLFLVAAALCAVAALVGAAQAAAPPQNPPAWPEAFNVTFNMSVAGQLDNVPSALYYDWNQQVQLVEHDTCPILHASSCKFLFLPQALYLVYPLACCEVAPIGPVAPNLFSQNFTYNATTTFAGQRSYLYTLAEDDGRINSVWTTANAAQSPLGLAANAPPPISALLTWQFTSGFADGPQDPSLFAKPLRCLFSCPSVAKESLAAYLEGMRGLLSLPSQ